MNNFKTYKDKECDIAVRENNLEELKRLHSLGYKWDRMTTHYAAYTRNLEILRYLVENGCEIDEITCAKYAEEFGDIEIFKYCFEICTDHQTFFDCIKIIYLLDKIDLTDDFWKKLFYIDLSENSCLEDKVWNYLLNLDDKQIDEKYIELKDKIKAKIKLPLSPKKELFLKLLIKKKGKEIKKNK